MKIQLENYGYKYTIETTHNDICLDEYLNLFKGLMIQATFSEQQFKKAILEMAEEINDNGSN
jgi:hypothetical protein